VLVKSATTLRPFFNVLLCHPLPWLASGGIFFEEFVELDQHWAGMWAWLGYVTGTLFAVGGLFLLAPRKDDIQSQMSIAR